ncbi:hypothetical protein [Nostoc sp. FACHB-280]|uniref:hypothetical protein n=1 Tax=Nostoc sp. FACHB-280 TaxID=2692839 RepID=UPI00168AD58E|nr:hypothetical protein [Nostoc sp. FACHB-280]MBD2494030.1 hypothetical protein [Nostoc sp. FACHB-280]
MKFYLLNYSDDRFNRKGGVYRQNQLNLNKTAREQGINNIVSWEAKDLIKTDFYAKHKEYLDKPSSENGYVFKSYIIAELLKKIEYGDILFYYDCGTWGIRQSVQPLIDLCISNNGTVFHQVRFKNSHWTKRDTFVYMNCEEVKYHEARQIQATWMLLQKNDFVINFVNEWLQYNLDERIASQSLPNTCGLPNLPGFKKHRNDQSIITNLVIKYGIKTFEFGDKDINIFINLLKTPAFLRKPKHLIYKLKNRLSKQWQ